MTPSIQADHITKDFHGTKAVNNISFEISNSEIFGFLGPNGAGKTTTLRMIATLLTPTSGKMTVQGLNTVSQSEEIRKKIGVLTTDIGVYDRLTGRENLDYFGKLYGMSEQTITKRIDDLGKSLEMEWFLDRPSGEYSTGMKQKIAIARSVIHDPEILIFDEPTTGLDVLASQTVLNFMTNARSQGKTVIFSTHQMFDAQRLCDRVAIFNEGEILIIETVKEVMHKTETKDLEEAFLKLVHHKKGDAAHG